MRRCAAAIFAALEAMLHDELLYTHSSGLTDTKATWLASLRSGKTKYKSAACSDRKVRLAGDTALVTGRAAIEAENAPYIRKITPRAALLGTLAGVSVRSSPCEFSGFELLGARAVTQAGWQAA